MSVLPKCIGLTLLSPIDEFHSHLVAAHDFLAATDHTEPASTKFLQFYIRPLEVGLPLMATHLEALRAGLRPPTVRTDFSHGTFGAENRKLMRLRMDVALSTWARLLRGWGG